MASTFVRRRAFLALSMILGVAITGCQPQVGAVVRFAINDPSVKAADQRATAEKVASVLNDRLDDNAKAIVLPDGMIAVEIYGDVEEHRLEEVRRRVTTQGELQFRIMASRRMQADVAILAKAGELAADAGNEIRVGDEVVAQWFDCDPTEFPDGDEIERRGLVGRKKGDVWQALALMNDGLDVTGAFLESTMTDVDETGRPQVSFSFNAEGAFLFGQLTGQHVPTRSGQRYNLGMILDDLLLSAPTIESKITDRGRISGNMSKDEVKFLVAILDAGRLPCAIREVDVTRPEE